MTALLPYSIECGKIVVSLDEERLVDPRMVQVMGGSC